MSNFYSALTDLVAVTIVLGIMIFVHEWDTLSPPSSPAFAWKSFPSVSALACSV